MFKIHKIIFKNFIPYYNVKTFEFGDKDGTTMIYGDNNTGKTSFIKGIRFLFFNYLTKNPDDHNYDILVNINTKAYMEEQYEFFVNMDFTYDGKKYNFMRRYIKKSSVIGEPQSDMDYDHFETIHLILSSGKKLFTKHETSQLIERIIPKNISEFIFFDGENIKKYVEILNNDGESGQENRRVKNAINDIIGTPYLDGLINHLEIIKDNVEASLLKSVKSRTKDEKLKKEINVLEEKRNNIKESLAKANLEYSNYKNKNHQLDSQLQQISKNIKVVEELNIEESNIKREEERLIELNSSLINKIVEMSKPMIYGKLARKKDELSSEYNVLFEKQNKFKNTKSKISSLKDLISSQKCSLCGNHLKQDNQKEISNKISELEKEIVDYTLTDEMKDKLIYLSSKIGEIDSLQKDNKSLSKNEIIEISQDIVTCKSKINNSNRRIRFLKKELGDESNDISIFIKNKIDEKSRIKQLLNKYEEQIASLKKDFDDTSNKIKRNLKRVSDTSKSNHNDLEKKINMLNGLIKKYQKVKDKFIEDMRKKVENSANELFIRCISGTNEDIARIGINENYKMTIYLENGSKIHQPSSGFNNLLALSLIYGLNKNSNLFGVIIFDGALSNMSKKFTHNIVSTLNEYAPQLIFLAHKDKIDLDYTRKSLDGKIQNEFELYQDGDSQNTKIRRV